MLRVYLLQVVCSKITSGRLPSELLLRPNLQSYLLLSGKTEPRAAHDQKRRVAPSSLVLSQISGSGGFPV